MKVVAVIQARTGSSRLPGKVLLPLAGATLLERMVERVQAARTLDEVIVATTRDASDDPIRDVCARAGVRCHSGHPTDLLDRHLEAGQVTHADAVVKIPSDCPCIDPRIIDRVVHTYRARPSLVDFVSNLHPATWPDGNDVEVIPMPVLETAWQYAKRPHEREHTTPYIWDRPNEFRLENVAWESGLDFSMSHRLTIDYPEDYQLIRAVFDELYLAGKPPFALDDILALLAARPEIFAINSHLAGVNWYRHHLDELRTVSADATVRPPSEIAAERAVAARSEGAPLP